MSWRWGRCNANPVSFPRLYGYEGETCICAFWWVDWSCLSFGVHLCLRGNVEIHLPFGFIRIGKRHTW